ncbi:hypothetical protein NKJ26_17020 [Mesorhizobium sp. M0152]|uniref:hypothetical protein n=1 Tax=Mesorhizobium sp. M0152 TaxID=2956898 RepID=UPI00333BE913
MDPLAEAIAEYRAGMVAFAALPSELTDIGNEEEFVQTTLDKRSIGCGMTVRRQQVLGA